MMKNGPNGTYVRRLIRRVTSSTDDHDARQRPARRRRRRAPGSPPASSPTPTRSFTSPIPNAPAPNGIDGRYRTAGMATAARIGRQQVRRRPAGSAPLERVDQRDRDDRQGQDVRQQPLVEVGREPDDQRRRTTPRTATKASGSPPNRSGSSPKRDGPDAARTTRRPPVDRGGRADAPRRAPASASRTGRRRAPGRARAAEQPGERLQRVGGASRPCRRSVSRPRRRPGPARRASRARRRSRRAARTASPCGSRPCRRCRGGPTARSRTRAGTARS